MDTYVNIQTYINIHIQIFYVYSVKSDICTLVRPLPAVADVDDVDGPARAAAMGSLLGPVGWPAPSGFSTLYCILLICLRRSSQLLAYGPLFSLLKLLNICEANCKMNKHIKCTTVVIWKSISGIVGVFKIISVTKN